MSELKWWFAPANHGEIKGENTGDKEIFKKETYISLAREILQNSIDARDSDEEPVHIEFKEFTMKKENIPGLEQYVQQIKRCASYWKNDKDFRQKYEAILEYLDSNSEIGCLRISDYNTTGLNGIENDDSTADTPYNALVKGTGVSKKKNDYAGGTKGVGKNVPFLLSKLMMVFYVTNTTDGYYGSVGVAKLSSGFVDDNEADTKRDYTQGTGYYAQSDKVSPIIEYYNLETGYNNRIDNCGTDIYIIGFEAKKGWMNDVINSALESFMVSIIKNQLSIKFNDVMIDNNTVDELVYSDYIDSRYKKSIVAQYEILRDFDSTVVTYDIETEIGNATMMILPYKKADEAKATKKCAMIRTPYMLIRNYDLAFGVSAMVIIDKNQLGKMLRNIENAQHNDWETTRIKDPSEKKTVDAAIYDMRNQIADNVLDCLKISDDCPIDPNGAGEFLPGEEEGSNLGSNSKVLDTKDVASSSQIRIINYSEVNANVYDTDGSGVQPDIGSIDASDDGDEVLTTGENESGGGEPHAGEDTGEKKPGESEILTRTTLSSVRYKVISTDKDSGRLRIIFRSPDTIEKCYLNLSLLDDANNATKLEILDLLANNMRIEYDDMYEPGPFKIVKNEKTILDVRVDKNEYFACEVKVKYENR